MIKKLAGPLIKAAPTVLNSAGKKSKSLIKLKGDLAKLPPHVVSGISDAVGAVTECLKLAETEQSKRVEIIARRDVAIAAIQAQRENFKELMSYTFQERASVLQKQFETLEKAVAGGDTNTVAAALNSMVAVIQTTPFKSAEELHKALGSKDFVVRLD